MRGWMLLLRFLKGLTKQILLGLVLVGRAFVDLFQRHQRWTVARDARPRVLSNPQLLVVLPTA